MTEKKKTEAVQLWTPSEFKGSDLLPMNATPATEALAVEGVPLVGSENIEWTWNADEQRFDRSQRGRPHDDSTFGRIRAANVVVMGVEYRPSVADRRSPEAQTIGEGFVWIFTDGQLREGLWQRDANTEPIRFVTGEGDPIELAPGNTWIELADNADLFAGRIEVLPAAPASP